MLTLDHIAFSYDRESTLQNISLELKPGLIHGLLGANGAGKTTLFEIITGNLPKQQGSLSYNDKELSRDIIAYQPTNSYFYTLITGREYLKLHQYRNPGFQIDSWNEIFKLPLDNLIDSYSSGMKKRLSLMAMICLDRPVMLFDEPFNNLDLEANQFLIRLLRMLADDEKTIVLSSHFVEIMTTVSDRIYLLEKGVITNTVERSYFNAWKKTYRSSEVEKATNLANELLQEQKCG